MTLFRRGKKKGIQERKPALISHVEQLRKELDSKSGEDYRQSLEHIVNSILSVHSAENAQTPNKHKRTRS